MQVTQTQNEYQSGRGRIELVEVMRGIAALAVVLLHAASGMALPQYSGHVGLGGIFRLGFLGVDFFFVLSGFIILFVHFGDIGEKSRLKRYGWRRLVRIFPTYWIILIIFLAANLLLQSQKAPISNPVWLVKELFFLKSDLWLSPAWTLQHELAFYFLFSSLILSRPVGLGIIFIWMGSILILMIFHPAFYDYLPATGWGTHARTFMRVLLHPINLDFLFGMSVAYVARARPKCLPLVAVMYLVFFIVAGLLGNRMGISWDSIQRFPWVGSLFAAVLAFVVSISRHVRNVPKALTFLGTISYSLYLSHVMPAGMVFAFLQRLGWYSKLSELLVFLLAVSASILFASLCYTYLEKPVIRRLQSRVQ
jgi:exopolysaccharide production protein ExoZ